MQNSDSQAWKEEFETLNQEEMINLSHRSKDVSLANRHLPMPGLKGKPKMLVKYDYSLLEMTPSQLKKYFR